MQQYWYNHDCCGYHVWLIMKFEIQHKMNYRIVNQVMLTVLGLVELSICTLREFIMRKYRYNLLLIVIPLLISLLFVLNPVPAGAGTISGSFTSLTDCPVRLTCLVVDPTTGFIYAQADRGTAYYRYNISLNSWSNLAACPIDSGNNGGGTYLNGKIYNSYCQSGTDMAVYNIGTNSWSTISGSPFSGNIATDGTDIYISAYNNFSKYDVSAGSWVSLTGTTTYSWGGLQYYNGYFYAHWGNSSKKFQRYSVSGNTWENLPDVPGPAVLGSAIFDAYYYCMGDYGGTNLYSYDLGAGEWNNTLTLPFTIDDTSIVVYDNSLYIAQGEAGTGFSKFTPNNPILSGIEGTSLSYPVGGSAKVVTSSITGSDNDDTNFESGTVSITANFVSGMDTLAFTNQNGISGSWSDSTGVLTLTGSATIANWITGLRSVTYLSSSSSSGSRTVSFKVRDGENDSNIQSRIITLTLNAPAAQSHGGPSVGGKFTPANRSASIVFCLVPVLGLIFGGAFIVLKRRKGS
jgi:hypothetical protein